MTQLELIGKSGLLPVHWFADTLAPLADSPKLGQADSSVLALKCVRVNRKLPHVGQNLGP